MNMKLIKIRNNFSQEYCIGKIGQFQFNGDFATFTIPNFGGFRMKKIISIICNKNKVLIKCRNSIFLFERENNK